MSALTNRSSIGSVSGNDGPSDNNVLSPHKILTLTFNQDCTALAMGTVKTYSLFTINQDNNIDEIHNCGIEPFNNIPHMPYEEIRILERLFSSSLIALVSSQAPRKLKVCNFKDGTEICSYSYSNSILTVKLNRSRLVVCLDESIYIHNMRDMKVLHTIRDVPPNPYGLCALSITDSSPYVAYPGSSIIGEIQIFDIINLRPGILISAHEGPLAAINFDMSGTKIATASTKGTVIRIHNAIDGTCLFEFRRGVRRVATIYSLAFSPDSMFLAASSNTGTIHIFRLTNQKQKAPEEPGTWMGSFNRLLGGVAYYLPKETSEVLTQDRAFAFVHLQSVQMKSTIAMNILNKTLKLFVAGYDGVICVYEVNTNDGGECKQISQYLLSDMSQNSNNQQNLTANDGRNTVDGSVRNYPSNVLRRENITIPLSSTLTNEKYYDDQSYNTAIGDRSLPPLSSSPQVDNE